MEWVVRRYLHYFERKGYSSISVSIEDVCQYVFAVTSEMKTSSLHNVFLYLKYFHIFLKEEGPGLRLFVLV